MFKYYKGYEIDGSDTAYNIIIPDMKKIEEIVNYYLSLKVIHKNKKIILKFNRNSIKKYSIHELDEMWHYIYENNLKSFEIEYTYVATQNLYSEVKREIIDYLLEDIKIKPKLIDPNFTSSKQSTDYITVNCFNNKSVKVNKLDDITSSDYHNNIIGNHKLFNINFDCSVVRGNTSVLLAYYALRKISERFLELGINPENSINESLCSCCYDVLLINAKNHLKEEISFKSNDLIFTINKFIDCENFRFYVSPYYKKLRPRKNSNEIIPVISAIRYYDCDVMEYEVFDANKNLIDAHKTTSKNKIIAKIFKNTLFKTVEQYVDFVETLSKVKFVTNEMLRELTFCYGIIKDKKRKDEFYVGLFFDKIDNDLVLKLSVPYDRRSYVINNYKCR